MTSELPHKGPVMLKTFQYHDFIMNQFIYLIISNSYQHLCCFQNKSNWLIICFYIIFNYIDNLVICRHTYRYIYDIDINWYCWIFMLVISKISRNNIVAQQMYVMLVSSLGKSNISSCQFPWCSSEFLWQKFEFSPSYLDSSIDQPSWWVLVLAILMLCFKFHAISTYGINSGWKYNILSYMLYMIYYKTHELVNNKDTNVFAEMFKLIYKFWHSMSTFSWKLYILKW